MSDFTGTLILEDEAIPARAVVGSGRLSLSIGDTEVGSWPLAEVTAQDRAGRVALVAGGERIELGLSNSADFVDAVAGVGSRGGKTKKRRVPKQARRKPKAPRRPRVSPAAVALGIALVALAVCTYFYTELVASIVLLVGLLLLTLGSIATTEPKVALRMPFGISALALVAAGGVLVVAGVGLILVA